MVYFGKKSIGDLEALKQQIQALEQALNNTAKTNTANTFTQNQRIDGQLEVGREIRAGRGGELIRFTPEDNTTKTLQFFENQPTDSKKLMLKVATPTDNNHVTNKEYVDNRIKYVEKVGGLSFTRDNPIIENKLCKYWARVNYSDLGIPNGKTIISCNIAKPADSKSISLSFFPVNTANQALIEIYQYNETTDISSALNALTYCFTYIN